MKVTKTNAARWLDKQEIPYRLIPYRVDESDLGAVKVAAQLNEPVERVFKTLVLRGDKTGIFVCVVPGHQELDLKKAARISGNKSADMLPVKDLLPVTGYIRGGCSPIGMKKRYPVYIHESCRIYDSIFISAGIRGIQIEINPDDLIRTTGMTAGDLISAGL